MVEQAPKREPVPVAGGFAVQLKYDCPHVEEHVGDLEEFKGALNLEAPCPTCSNIGENWICLKCFSINCSRYVNEHALLHAVTETHSVAMSFSDLSVWCYQCDDYVGNARLQALVSHASSIKFQEEEIVQKLEEGFKISEQAEEFNYDVLVRKLKSGEYRNIVVMSGAGISVSAGIPDFRSPETGLYSIIKKEYDLASPELIFHISQFRENPEPFYKFASQFDFKNCKPTPTHQFIKLLDVKELLLLNFTQNIDTLERKAGISEDKLVEAHGSIATAHCIDCHSEFPRQEMEEHVANATVPRCSACNGLVKPDIIFFGEQLPASFMSNVHKMQQADLLLVMGTSLQVMPFAALKSFVREEAPKVLINMTEISGFDLQLTGPCDEQIRKLVSDLQWGKEYEELTPTQHGAKI